MADDFPPGSVWLVGAGPGDPELLTRKAERLIRQASVVFHDALVGPEVLDMAATGARVVSVGKRSGRHSKGQRTIDALIVKAALAGERVVRLKGGDPSIFGRSSEEVEACRVAKVPVRVCPGVTAASAAVANLNLSLTMRGVAGSSRSSLRTCAPERNSSSTGAPLPIRRRPLRFTWEKRQRAPCR